MGERRGFLTRERSFSQLWGLYLAINGLGLVVIGVLGPSLFASEAPDSSFDGFWMKFRLVGIVGGVALLILAALRVRSEHLARHAAEEVRELDAEPPASGSHL